MIMETETSLPSEHQRKTKMVHGIEWHIIKKSLFVVAGILILLLADANYGIFSVMRQNSASGTKWQAVFLTNNQVYFGHLSPYGFGAFVLHNAYYIHTTQVPVTPSPTEKNPPAQPKTQTRNELVPATQDPQAPEDAMFIPKNQVLFWQNLRDDSPVVRTIRSSVR